MDSGITFPDKTAREQLLKWITSLPPAPNRAVEGSLLQHRRGYFKLAHRGGRERRYLELWGEQGAIRQLAPVAIISSSSLPKG